VIGAPDGADVSMARARRAVEAGCRWLLDQQDPVGCWPFDQPTRVEAAAEDVLLAAFVGERDDGLAEATARWLRSRQLGSGGWAARAGRPADLSASVLAYCALRLAGDPADAYHMALAAGWIRDAGGLLRAGAHARVWLAMFGYARWQDLRIPPPESVCLRAAYPVRLPRQPGWGAGAGPPLAVVAALRPARRLPFGLAELRTPAVTGPARHFRPAGHSSLFRERQVSFGPARTAALRRCAESVLAGQQPDGSWAAEGPSWQLSLIALHLLGLGSPHPAYARGLAALRAHSPVCGTARYLGLADYAVGGTAGAVLALADSGLQAGHPALLAAGDWLLAAELQAADGRRRGAAAARPGDCGLVLTALRRCGVSAEAVTLRSARWLAAVQGRDGGWPSGPAHRATHSAEATAGALSGLAAVRPAGSVAARRAVVGLLGRQLPDGAWAAGQNGDELQPTCAVLAAVLAAGVPPSKAPVRRAADWLALRQNPDGGWGEAGLSAPAATAGAVLALLAAGRGYEATARHGAGWLVWAQGADGSWTDQSRPVLAATLPLRALGGCVAAGLLPADGPEAEPDEGDCVEDLAG